MGARWHFGDIDGAAIQILFCEHDCVLLSMQNHLVLGGSIPKAFISVLYPNRKSIEPSGDYPILCIYYHSTNLGRWIFTP